MLQRVCVALKQLPRNVLGKGARAPRAMPSVNSTSVPQCCATTDRAQDVFAFDCASDIGRRSPPVQMVLPRPIVAKQLLQPISSKMDNDVEPFTCGRRHRLQVKANPRRFGLSADAIVIPLLPNHSNNRVERSTKIVKPTAEACSVRSERMGLPRSCISGVFDEEYCRWSSQIRLMVALNWSPRGLFIESNAGPRDRFWGRRRTIPESSTVSAP